jgi:hypothetical protein
MKLELAGRCEHIDSYFSGAVTVRLLLLLSLWTRLRVARNNRFPFGWFDDGLFGV